MRKADSNLKNLEKTYDFIVSFYKANLKTPTYEEIASHMGFVHKQQCSYYIDKLRKMGKISTTPRVKRSIKIL